MFYRSKVWEGWEVHAGAGSSHHQGCHSSGLGGHLAMSLGQCWPELSSVSCCGCVPGVRPARLTAPSAEADSLGGETTTQLRPDISILPWDCARLPFGDLDPAPSLSREACQAVCWVPVCLCVNGFLLEV